MNSNCYKVIFSKRLGALVAVGEHACGQGKSASGQANRHHQVAPNFIGAIQLCAAAALLAYLPSVWAQSPLSTNALPSAPSVQIGSASISTTDAAMTINQASNKASINWQSFNIGSSSSVTVNQPNAQSVLLNRVVGNDPSQILGKLSANGQVILINPNGIVFGKEGSVAASSFTASTFGMTDADFLNGFYKYSRNASNAAILNQGSLTAAPGGYVALIGAKVTNDGKITARQGAVIMAAGEEVQLPSDLTVNANSGLAVPLSKRVRLELSPAAVNTVIENTADGVIVTEGGQVLMQASGLATAVANVTHAGRIDTSAVQAGDVTLLADEGQIRVSGSITANSSGIDSNQHANAGGTVIIGRNPDTGVLAKSTDVSQATIESNQGFVETSGESLLAADVNVKSGQWLLDPYNIEITNQAGFTTGYTSKVSASSLSTALNNGTTVTIDTSAGTTNVAATLVNSTGGDILVTDAITATGTATLNLNADRNITINNNITSAASNALNMNFTAGKTTAGGVNVNGFTLDGGNAGNIAITNTTANASGSGVTFNNSTIRTGGTIDITGVTSSIATDVSGVKFNNATSLMSTNNAAINITGTATTQGTSNRSAASGIQFAGGTVRLGGDGTHTGSSSNITLTGTSGTGAGIYSSTPGSIIETWTSGTVKFDGTTTGTPTITVNDWNAGLAISNGITAKAATKLVLKGAALVDTTIASGQNTATRAMFGINADTNFIGMTGATLTINASTNAPGTANVANNGRSVAYFQNSGNITGWDSINITATNSNSASSAYGIYAKSSSTSYSAGSISVKSAGQIEVQGAMTASSGDMTVFSNGGNILLGNTVTASRNVAISSTDATYTVTGTDVSLTSGGKTLGNITLGNTVTATTGDVLVAAAGGAISARSMTANRYVAVDNRGGNMTASTSALTLTNGGLNSGSQTGVYLQYANISANTVKIYGASNTSKGLHFESGSITTTGNNTNNWIEGTSTTLTSPGPGGIYKDNAAAYFVGANSLTANNGGTITVNGTLSANDGYGLSFRDNSTLTTVGNINLQGKAYDGAGVMVYNNINAQGQLSITGESTGTSASSRGVLLTRPNLYSSSIQNTTGDVNITGKTANLNGSGILTESGFFIKARNITLAADTMSLSGTLQAGTMDGTGLVTPVTGAAPSTVTLQNASNSRAISIGGSDSSSQLGLSSTELGLITAGKTIIGSSTAGNISVDAVITTNSTSGDFALKTAGNVSVNNALTVGASGAKNLTITATGASSAVSGSAAITANQLAITANTVALSTAANQVNSLAASTTGSFAFKNGKAITITTVDGITGLTTTGGASVETTTGDLSLAQNVTNNTSGNVVLAAGSATAAGTSTGGDINTTGGKVNQYAGGTTKLYTGSSNNGTSGSNAISSLVNGFSADLRLADLDASNKQNAKSNSAFGDTSLSETTQVYFREKINLGAVLNATATYGDALSGTNIQTLLSGSNTGVQSKTYTAGTFKINKTSLVAALNTTSLGSSSSFTYSASNHINANAIGYALDTITSNYTGISGTLVVNKANATVTANSGTTTYNGQLQSVSGFTASGLVNGESASVLSSVSASGSGTNAGTYSTIASGTDTNYNLSFVNGSLVIGKAKLTGISGSKTYDGQNTSLIAGISGGTLTLSGVASESATLTTGQTVTLSSANAGSRTVSSFGTATFTGANGFDINNYNVTNSDLSTLSSANAVTVAKANLTGISGSKTYDGQNTSLIAGTSGGTLTLSGVASESATLTTGQTVTLSSPNAGNSSVSSLDTATFTGTNNFNINNYNVTNNDLSALSSANAVSIAKANLTKVKVTKTYDGLSTANYNQVTVIQGVDGEMFSATAGTASISDKNVSTANKVLTDLSGLTVSGNRASASASNYEWSTGLPVAGTNNSVTINAKAITASGLSSADKTYDATTNATVNGTASLQATQAAGAGTSSDGKAYTNDNVSLSGTAAGSFNTKDVATATTVSFSGLSLTGTDASNYTLTQPASVSQHITKATLTASLIGTTSKEYDGHDTGTLAASNYSVSGLATGEGISISKNSGTYASVNVSSNTNASKGLVSTTFSASDITAGNNTDLNNYILPASAQGNIGVITPAALKIIVNNTATFVTQDANAAPNLGFSYDGLKNGELATDVLSGSYSRTYTGVNTPAAGNYTGVYGLSAIPTALNGNYTITVQNGNLTVVPADKLMITVASQSDVYGNRNANNAASANAGNVTAQYCLVSSNCSGANLVSLTVSKVNDTQWKATDNTNSSVFFDLSLINAGYSSGGYLKAGNYTYLASDISPSLPPNPNFVSSYSNGGVLTVNKLAASLSSSGVQKVYDGTTTANSASITVGNAMANDAVSGSAATGAFASANAATSVGYTLSGLGLTGPDASNYSLSTFTLSGNGVITPKPITLSGVSVASKVYDGTTTANVLSSGSLSGLVGNETLVVDGLTAVFADASIGTQKTVLLSATLGNGTGLANNYALTTSNASADITRPSNPQLPSHEVTPTPVDSPRWVSPFDTRTTQARTNDSCSADNLDSCLCEGVDTFAYSAAVMCRPREASSGQPTNFEPALAPEAKN